MRVAALGRTGMLLDSVKALRVEGHEVVIIATCRAAPEYEVCEDDFERCAEDMGCDFIRTQTINAADAVARLRASRADVAISVNWVGLVGAEVCGLFPFGVINAHAGELPRYRGNAPVAWALLNGETRVGMTLHQMDPFALDTGPTLLTDYYPLTDETYVGDVFAHHAAVTPRLFVAALAGLADGTVVPRPQPTDPRASLRCYPRLPEDGLLLWSQPTAALGRLVRASAEPFGGAFTYLGPDRLTVWRARAEPWRAPSLAVPGQVLWRRTDTGEVGIAALDGVLAVADVETPAGRGRASDVIRSLRARLRAVPGSA